MCTPVQAADAAPNNKPVVVVVDRNTGKEDREETGRVRINNAMVRSAEKSARDPDGGEARVHQIGQNPPSKGVAEHGDVERAFRVISKALQIKKGRSVSK